MQLSNNSIPNSTVLSAQTKLYDGKKIYTYTQANDYRSHVKQAMQITETNLPAKKSHQHKQT